VPIMLILVKIANNTKHWFPEETLKKVEMRAAEIKNK